jgi:hypothetical protein
MPSSRHHTEWLSLIEVSGPFLSVPVLERVFPHGLDKDDTPDGKELVRSLRLAFDEWEDDKDGERPNPAIHKAWIDYVIKQAFGLPDEVLAEGQDVPQTLKATIAEYGETLKPDLIVRNPKGEPEDGKARLLIKTYPATQGLDKPILGRHWKASPATRMMELLHATGIRLGLITNGEQWMLVDAPKGETTGFASWYAMLWFEEPLTLRAFRSLLGAHRFFSVDVKDTLEAMLAESASNQQEVTDRLGYQVREAVEEIIRCLDRIDQDEGRRLLEGVSESDLYEAALTVMMRLVFLFSAEERGLLLLGDPLYDEYYAVSTLVAKLQEAADQHGEEVLQRRHDAWVRLLSTFRAVYGGIQHERMKLLPYAGRLFSPDRFLFLEGRKKRLDDRGNLINDWTREEARPLLIDNRTVLHLLRSLQYLEMHGESRRLSFRALDIEQIGHVYEGLLDHTAKRATDITVSLIASKGDEPEVTVSELERLRSKGEAGLIKFLSEATARTENALKKALENPVEGEAAKKIRAASGDESTYNRLRPFSALIRNDTFDRPVVIRKGSVFVTQGTDRRSSGTHYTQRSLTEPIVQYTLEPLVYIGPAEGKPREEWKLRSAKELLGLKICDMACGSGAFLVQTDRYLSERLVEAWEDAEKLHPGVPGITPEGTASTGAANELIIPKDTNERIAYARRLIAQRSLYGIDKNPLAVEMAKLSLWLLTLAKDKPFTFLDHAIRCGDSLVGVNSETQLKTFSLAGQGIGITLPNFLDMIPRIMDATRLLRVRLEKIADDTIGNVEEKQRLFENVRFQTKRLNYAADRLLAASWRPAKPTERVALLRVALQEVDGRIRDVDPDTLEAEGRASREEVRCPQPFHWAMEFPEVFLDRGGFDAFVCNPPFMGGKKITGNLGTDYREYLVEHLARGKKGNADLCAYFFLRAGSLLRENGQGGLLATNSIAQGDTREVGLDQLTAYGFILPRAIPSRKWPGTASLEVAHIWMRKGRWEPPYMLDDKPVSGVSPYLTETGTISGPPHRLAINAGKSFIGSYVLGMGFVLEPDEAERLIAKDARNKAVLFPYLNGEDLNSRPDQTPSRWIINFFDWPLDRHSAPEGYEGPMAADYPDCLLIVQQKVKPERDKLGLKNDSSARAYAKHWWQYGRKGIELYRAIAGMERVWVRTIHANLNSIASVPTSIVFSHALAVFSATDYDFFSILQSVFHTEWLTLYGSSIRTDIRYTPSDCFETFVFPPLSSKIARIGERYYSVRKQVMLSRQEGLTKTYSRFHDPGEFAADIQTLRDLHVEMDKTVATAYGWDDLDLTHGFHEARQGTRFTIIESARRELLARLLKLNHERYTEEVKQGLHNKKGKVKPASSGRSRKSKASSDTVSLNFGDEEDELGPAKETDEESTPIRGGTSSKPTPADRRIQATPSPEPSARPASIDQLETDDIMAAFRQAARGEGLLDRAELLKEVSVVLGYQRLGPKILEALRGHLRAAIRRRIIETDGPNLVRAGAISMADYEPNELMEVFRCVMRKGTKYDREEVIPALARHLGFVRLTDSIREPIRRAITRAIRHGLLGYDGSIIWRGE